MRVGLFIFPIRFAKMLPIDIAYLSAYLKNRGHEVYLRDFNVELPVPNDCDDEIWIQIDNQKELFVKNKEIIEKWVDDILSFSPDLVGFSMWPTQFYFSLQIAKMIKHSNEAIKVVLGGPWCSQERERMQGDIIKLEYVDYIVLGEGEVTLAEIVESGDINRAIPGCIRKIGSEVIDGGQREEIVDLDSLSFPDYGAFNFNKYMLNTTYPILFNRGCNWNCSFCTYRRVWKRFRSRSSENIFSEIRHCLSKYDFIDRFYSCDHSMNANMALLDKLCNLLIKHGIAIKEFTGFGQINKRMSDAKFMNKLKRANFTGWGIGMQSGSDRVLKSMRRPYTATQAEIMIKIMSDSGMKPCIDFIIGYPEESEEDFRKTLEFISRVAGYVSCVSVMPHCNVNKNDLDFNREKYGIYTKEKRGKDWESVHSTPAIRARRHKEMMDHMSSLGLMHRNSSSDRKYHEIQTKKE